MMTMDKLAHELPKDDRPGDRGVAIRRRRAGALAVFAILLAGCAGPKQAHQATERLAHAQALFEQHCKTAGEKIYRTVDDVEGVYLLKLRPQGINHGDQFALDDPYGMDLVGAGYIGSFVRGEYRATHSGTPSPAHLRRPSGICMWRRSTPRIASAIGTSDRSSL